MALVGAPGGDYDCGEVAITVITIVVVVVVVGAVMDFKRFAESF